MRKYLFAYSLALQQTLQLRASLLMDRVGGFATLITLYFFWATLMGEEERFLGYDRSQMLSYVLAMNVLRSFVFTGRGWQFVREISSGRVSAHLLRPIDYRGYNLALDMAQKTVHLGAAILEIGLLLVLLDAPIYLPRHPLHWLLFLLATLLSSLIFFFLEFAVSALAFWTSESGGPLFCFELFLQFAAGVFFPLDVLPTWLKSALALTPFPYMVFFPIQAYLERISPAEAARVLGVQALWLSAAIFVAGRVWRKGLAAYAAEGG